MVSINVDTVKYTCLYLFVLLLYVLQLRLLENIGYLVTNWVFVVVERFCNKPKIAQSKFITVEMYYIADSL